MELKHDKSLLEAVLSEDYNEAKFLLSIGANPNRLFGEHGGISAFHIAVGLEQDLRFTRLFLQNKADVDLRSEKESWTPLHVCAYWNKFDSLQLLLLNGANASREDSSGNTALHIAAENNNQECVRVLTEFALRKKSKETFLSDASSILNFSNASSISTSTELGSEKLTGSCVKTSTFDGSMLSTQELTPRLNKKAELVDDLKEIIEEMIEMKLEEKQKQMEKKRDVKSVSAVHLSKIAPVTSPKPGGEKKTPSRFRSPEQQRPTTAKPTTPKSDSCCRIKPRLETPRKETPSAVQNRRLNKQTTPTMEPNMYSKLKGWMSKISAPLLSPMNGEQSSSHRAKSSNQRRSPSPPIKTRRFTRGRAEPVYSAVKSFPQSPEDLVYKVARGEIREHGSDSLMMLKTPDGLISSDESTLITNDSDLTRKSHFETACETLLNNELSATLTEVSEMQSVVLVVEKSKKERGKKKVEETVSPRPGAYSSELSDELESKLNMTSSSDVIVTNMFRCFQSPKDESSSKSVEWREGCVKAAFNYLLLDPRITKNLPVRAKCLSEKEVFKTFVASIFYIGKGSRARPYAHLLDTLRVWKSLGKGEHVPLPRHDADKPLPNKSKKIERIMSIWDENYGVVSLHCFQSVIPSEAYTREAAMIDTIGLQNLTNMKKGNYYGEAKDWSLRHKCQLGTVLLRRACAIFLAEGERQLFPNDI